MDIGLYNNSFIAGSKIAITDFETKITTDKQNKLTLMAVSFKAPQVINEMSFSIEPGIYLRYAKISIDKTQDPFAGKN